jgi:hypothetical protein
MPLAHPHAIAYVKARPVHVRAGVNDGRREHRPAQREPAARTYLKFGVGHQPMLYSQGGRRGEPVLVIARRQVMARLHALDRMAELAPAGLDRACYNYQQRPGHSLPPAAKTGSAGE